MAKTRNLDHEKMLRQVRTQKRVRLYERSSDVLLLWRKQGKVSHRAGASSIP
jgi:hypothetical protein